VVQNRPSYPTLAENQLLQLGQKTTITCYARGTAVDGAGQDVGAAMLSASETLDTEYTEHRYLRPPDGGCWLTVRNA